MISSGIGTMSMLKWNMERKGQHMTDDTLEAFPKVSLLCIALGRINHPENAQVTQGPNVYDDKDRIGE